jgi:hypothetical protein
MIVYNPQHILPERIKEAEEIMEKISAKYCFITGSFLYKKKYNDIDVFVISRSTKRPSIKNKNIKITIIDFNDLHSLFYHSISKSCIAKNILPQKKINATISDYWHIINEAIPTVLNQKSKYHKDVRFLILYTEYLKNNIILDTFELNEKISDFRNHKEILDYVEENVPTVMIKKRKKSYLKRFFYTQSGHYKELLKYEAQSFLYNLAHKITRGIDG